MTPELEHGLPLTDYLPSFPPPFPPPPQGGDVSVASLVKLLIIDEVHLLNDDRGPVIEALVARTLRQVRGRGRSGVGWGV